MQVLKGKKQEMTQLFLENGNVIPVTVLKIEGEFSTDLLDKKADLTGESKGKGFTGVMKKWNFSGQQMTRGQSDKTRAAGSIGAQTPGRVFIGKKMAGRHGNKRVTLKNRTIVGVNPAQNELMVKGPVPGARNSLVTIKILEKEVGN